MKKFLIAALAAASFAVTGIAPAQAVCSCHGRSPSASPYAHCHVYARLRMGAHVKHWPTCKEAFHG